MVWSTVYIPPPRSTTRKPVFVKPESHEPGWMLAAGLSGVQSESFAVSIVKVTLMARAGVASSRA